MNTCTLDEMCFLFSFVYKLFSFVNRFVSFLNSTPFYCVISFSVLSL